VSFAKHLLTPLFTRAAAVHFDHLCGVEYYSPTEEKKHGAALFYYPTREHEKVFIDDTDDRFGGR
jgi:hypothetical protein